MTPIKILSLILCIALDFSAIYKAKYLIYLNNSVSKQQFKYFNGNLTVAKP